MTDKPLIALKTPTVTDLDAGTYYWCACGRSSNQPFCDGSHAGTSFQPVEIKLDEKKRVALCNCKQTAKGPYCDGAHKHV